jgi:hypothetical protein
VHALRAGAGEIAALRATFLLGILFLLVMLWGYVLTHAPLYSAPLGAWGKQALETFTGERGGSVRKSGGFAPVEVERDCW